MTLPTTTTTDSERHPIDVLAEDFVARYRRGECPDIAEIANSNPQLASEINMLFPMIEAMEQLKGPGLELPKRPVQFTVTCPQKLGDFRIVREIGRGGMGIVYEAEQQSLGRRVAVKVLAGHALADDKRLKRFLIESQTAARLHHSNIVPVFGIGQDEGLHYFVMQYIHGVGLDKIIRQVESTCGTEESDTNGSPSGADPDLLCDADTANIASNLATSMICGTLQPSDVVDPSPPNAADDSSIFPASHSRVGRPGAQRVARRVTLDPGYWRSVAEVGVQVAEALQYAHTHGTVHRDIKPANLLIDKFGVVWVTDFGLAKAAAQDAVNRTREIGGTLRYMAPEQFRGDFHPQSDVYSLGVTLYELAVLRPAFPETDPDQLILYITQTDPPPPGRWNRAIPRDLETIILKATSRDLRRRYATAGDLADDLQRFLEDKPIFARRIKPLERAVRWSRRNPAVASLAMLLLIVVLGAFSTVSWKWREAEAENHRAESNLSLALDSMNSTMDQFASTWMAHPIGPQAEDDPGEMTVRILVSDESAAILQDALKFYNQFAMQNSGNPRLRLDTARAHRRVGQLRHRLGQLEKAESSYRTAALIYREVLHESPDDTEVLRRLVTVLNDLGGVIQESGRLSDAEKPFVEARELLLADSSKSLAVASCRYELSCTYSNMGNLLMQMGSRTDGADNQRRAMELLQELTSEQPSNPEFRLAQARCYRNLYWTSFLDRGGSSESYKSSAISILESLTRDFPDVPDYQCDLAEILCLVSTRSGQEQQLDEIAYELRLAIDICRYLNGKYPAIPRYTAGLARATQRLGSVLASNRKREEAETWLNESVDIYRNLMNRYPTVEGYKSYFSSASFARGENLRSLGQLPESRTAIESAIAYQREVFELRSPNSFERGMMAREYTSLAETLKLLNEPQLARDAEAASREFWTPPRWPTSRPRWPSRSNAQSWKKSSRNSSATNATGEVRKEE